MNTSIDQIIGALAAQQHGVFTRLQARVCGATRSTIARRLRTGAWCTRSSRVLGITGAPFSARARLLAAVLHIGDGAVVSHAAAAALHRLPGFDLDEIHVTRPRGPHWHTAPYGAMHELALDGFTTEVDGIPVTTVPRTLFDLAATEHPRRVERALDNALAMRLTSVPALELLVRGSRGRTGVKLMRQLVEARKGGYVPPASELEARFLELVRHAGLPEPARQLRAGGRQEAGRVDMAWRSGRLLVELDSRRHHRAVLDEREDVRRDLAVADGGWRVLRITWEDVFAYPDRTVARLAGALDDAAMRLRAG